VNPLREAPPQQPVLSVEDLSVEIPTSRGVVRAVRHVSLAIQSGETFALVGESGSGKTMTCRAILRLVPAPGRIVGGAVRYRGEDLVKLPAAVMDKVRGVGISMIFQDPMTALHPMLTVEQQLCEAWGRGVPRSEARSRAVELLRQVGLADAERRLRDYPHQLSGGQRQRVMIAIALTRGPDLLIADEPTTALDVTIQAQILGLLKDLQRRLGMALLLVTHDLGVVADVADRVAVMYGGEIVESGPAVSLLRAPRHPYTVGLLSSMPSISAAKQPLQPIEGLPPDLAALPPGCPFHPRCRWALPACQVGEIPFAEVGPDHLSRCLRVGEPEILREGESHGLHLAR
jgi:oligopeptide transport system ATP-binding protein